MLKHWFSKKHFLDAHQLKKIEKVISDSEKLSSGEIRVYLEPACKIHTDPLVSAQHHFNKLEMWKTAERNAILIYIAYKTKKIAIFADQGIHEKMGDEFWNKNVQTIIQHFKNKNFLDGLTEMIIECSTALATHFPYNELTDKNELSNEIVLT